MQNDYFESVERNPGQINSHLLAWLEQISKFDVCNLWSGSAIGGPAIDQSSTTRISLGFLSLFSFHRGRSSFRTLLQADTGYQHTHHRAILQKPETKLRKRELEKHASA
ncbi:hypothetical protein KC328_g95 [Hortaea werneckii]|nr:hypothetical protein KC328_g95 [Hortaea werneckii]